MCEILCTGYIKGLHCWSHCMQQDTVQSRMVQVVTSWIFSPYLVHLRLNKTIYGTLDKTTYKLCSSAFVKRYPESIQYIHYANVIWSMGRYKAVSIPITNALKLIFICFVINIYLHQTTVLIIFRKFQSDRSNKLCFILHTRFFVFFFFFFFRHFE